MLTMTTDNKTLHPSSSTLCTKETIFGKTPVPMFKGTHERFSSDSSRISLSGTIIDFTQIVQSFNNLCQTTTTSADPPPQKTLPGVLMGPDKRVFLALTLHQLLPPVLTLQQAVLQLLITCPAPAASPGKCTQHPAAAAGPKHQHPLSDPFLTNSAFAQGKSTGGRVQASPER